MVHPTSVVPDLLSELIHQKSSYVEPQVHLLLSTGTAVTRLMELSDEERRPHELAHVRAHLLIAKLSDLEFNIPANDVYSDPDQAIRLLWTNGERSVQLVFPSSVTELPYLYYSDHEEFGIEENPTPQSALEWLRWVAGAAQHPVRHSA